MLPKARTEKLTVEELPDETLVFDHQRGKAHCLNPVSRLIWKHCDGHTNLAGLAALVHRQFGIPSAEVVVELALEQLGQRHLLQASLERPSAERRRSRRDLLKKMAMAAVVLPVVMTVAAPKASALGSLACEINADCKLFNLNFGCIVGICVNFRCQQQQQPDETVCFNPTKSSCINGSCVPIAQGR